MQRLEVSGAVRHIYASLGFKGLKCPGASFLTTVVAATPNRFRFSIIPLNSKSPAEYAGNNQLYQLVKCNLFVLARILQSAAR